MGNFSGFSNNDLLKVKTMNARDKRANSLKLNPRAKQTNYFKHFHIDPPATDIDIVNRERIQRCVAWRNGK